MTFIIKFNLATKRLGSHGLCLIFPFRNAKESQMTHANAMARNLENLKKKYNTDTSIFHIKDEKVADLVIDSIGIKANKNIPILEINPGPGVLTKKLLQENFNKVYAFENRNSYLPLLNEIADRNNQQLLIISSEDFYKWSKNTKSKLDWNSKFIEIANIPIIPWNEDIAMRIIGFIPPKIEMIYLRSLFRALINFNYVFMHGRCEFHFFVSEKEYKYMSAQHTDKKNIYVATTVLYQLFFDIELIDKVPNTSFEPKPFRKLGKLIKYDNTVSCLVKLVPKLDLINLVPPPNQLSDLYFFIKQNLARRKDFVIANLEKWIPNCGPRLIKTGIPIFTKFGNIPPSMILDLFREFVSLHEYRDSTFRNVSHKEYFGNIREDED